MKHSTKSKLFVLCGLVLLLSGCTEIAITGRKQFNLVPDTIMHSMSYQSYSEFISENTLSTNAVQTQTVKDVGQKIQKAVEQYCAENNLSHRLKGYGWEFNLVEDPNVNAWCMPGGKVVVYTGLLPITQNQPGLAVVMGHEIAHAVTRHGAERMSHQQISNGVGQLGAVLIQGYAPEYSSAFDTAYSTGVNVGVMLPFSRSHENEADEIGIHLMYKAGYNINEAVNFWKNMKKLKGESSSTNSLFSTHPSDDKRIKNIAKIVKKIQG